MQRSLWNDEVHYNQVNPTFIKQKEFFPQNQIFSSQKEMVRKEKCKSLYIKRD